MKIENGSFFKGKEINYDIVVFHEAKLFEMMNEDFLGLFVA